MDKRKKDWIKIGLISGIGAVRGNILLREFQDLDKALSASREELENIEGIGPKLAEKIVSSRNLIDIDAEIRLIEKAGVDVVSIEDTRYPENLKNIYSPPLVLYVKGTLKPQDRYSIAMVGTRRASMYGRQNAQRLGMQLAERGFTVVSGLARGIDTSAHRAALQARGRTIAVLGSGIDVAYPAENKGLMEEISKNGAVISEFPMGTLPEKQNFPARNRIISGLSLGVVVVEAARKSGALITASFALEQDREVFSIPGRIDDLRSKGTLGLIKEGAKLVETVDDILEEVEHPDFYENNVISKEGITKKHALTLRRRIKASLRVNPEPVEGLKDNEEAVFNILSGRPIHIDEIKDGSDLDFGRISRALLDLQMKGIVREMPGKKFVRVDMV